METLVSLLNGVHFMKRHLNLVYGDYAQPFIEVPQISVMPTNTFFVEKDNDVTTTSWGRFWACRPESSSGYYVAVSCIAIGRWK